MLFMSILQSPARHPLFKRGDHFVCAGTGRRYPVVNGTPHVYDDMDVSPFLRRDFDRFSDAWALPKGAHNPEWEAVVAAYDRAKRINTDWMFLLNSKRPMRVLEIGVGDAGLIKRFAAAGHECWAMDFFTWEMEASRGDSGIHTISAPMSRLPFVSGAFDLIYFHAAIHHALPNDPADFQWSSPGNLVDCLQEIRRVLKADGVFFLTGEGLYPDDVQDREHERKCQADPACVYESWYTMAEYETAFRAAGCFPNLWVDQHIMRMRAHGYRDGERVPLVDESEGIEDGAVLVGRLGDLLPEWLSAQ